MEIPIVIDSDTANLRHDIRASVFDLPANTAFRAQVSVMNGHHAGPPSDTIDFKTSEGGQFFCRILGVWLSIKYNVFFGSTDTLIKMAYLQD